MIDQPESNHPVFSPGQSEWRRSGEILERLRASRGFEARKLRDVHFDALIALTAHAAGATVVTCNRSDFEALREHVRFDLLVWE